MALFSNRYIEEEYIDYKENRLVKTPSHGTIISKCMTISGDLKSCEPIVIEGILDGNIKCEDIVIVSRTASVIGKIEAKELRVDGRVEGPVEAAVVELTQNSNQEGYILAKVAIVNGNLDGDIVCEESLEIGEDANVDSYECQASTITVEGSLKGIITAKKLLDIGAGAKVVGSIKAKEIKSELGSRIEGKIAQYGRKNIINSKLNKTENSIEKEQIKSAI
jgi:cytoskeletal protein CcmA (bactofilin family)